MKKREQKDEAVTAECYAFCVLKGLKMKKLDFITGWCEMMCGGPRLFLLVF